MCQPLIVICPRVFSRGLFGLTDDARAGQGAPVMAKLILGFLLTLAITRPSIGQAAPTPAQLCESAIELASAKYAQCRLTAESKFSKSGDATKQTTALTKCSQRLSDAFSKATLRYGAPNCTGSPSTAYEAYVNECSDEVAAAAVAGGFLPSCGNGTIDVVGEQCDGADLGGETCASLGFPGGGALGCAAGCLLDTSACMPSLCGNGVIDGAEQCDGTDLGGATCTSLGFTNGGTLGCTSGCGYDVGACQNAGLLATGQTICWALGGPNQVPCPNTGQDADYKRGSELDYIDNGDGTITDVNTSLMWEKLADDGSVHDKDLTYEWNWAYQVKIATLNGSAFAGHTDWRLPNRRELESIVNLDALSPAIAGAFRQNCTPGCSVLTCSCTPSGMTWSSSSLPQSWEPAWFVDFNDGRVYWINKSTPLTVRAVRGGS